MKASQKCIDLIKEFESFSPTVYICPAGRKTIGYGTLWYPGMPEEIDEPTGLAWLIAEVDSKEPYVEAAINVPINQNQFDALVDFAYNLGVGALKSSTLLKKLNNGDYEGAAAEFDRWVYGGGKILPGLVRRRNVEREMFEDGVE